MKNILDLLLTLSIGELENISLNSPMPEKVVRVHAVLTEDFKNMGLTSNDPEVTFIKLQDTLKKVIPHEGISNQSMEKLDKLNQLCGGMGKIGILTMELYKGISTMIPLQKTIKIKSTIEEYYKHLGDKLSAEGITAQDKSFEYSPKQNKLIARYKAIQNVHNNIKNNTELTSDEINSVKEAVEECINNRPDWSERPFLQKLTDVLSLGLKPLYRAFLSKEAILQNKLGKLDIIEESADKSPIRKSEI